MNNSFCVFSFNKSKMTPMFKMIWNFVQRKIETFIFWIFHPRSFGSEVINLRNIAIGSGSKASKGSRLFCFDKNSKIWIGKKVWMARSVDLHARSGNILRIGDFSSVQDNCKLIGQVSIGRYCILAPNVFMSSGAHQFSVSPSKLIRIQDLESPLVDKPIKIEEDVWLGINVVVSGGITIGRGAIVGASSVVTKDIPPYTICAGIPAKVIGERLQFRPSPKIDSKNLSDYPYFYSGFDHFNITDQGLKVLDSIAQIRLSAVESSTLRIAVNVVGQEHLEISLSVTDLRHSAIVKKGENLVEMRLPKLSGDVVVNLHSQNNKGNLYVLRAELSS
jgi:acetyltransferase-like isoleucine patch superfamily enzyme